MERIEYLNLVADESMLMEVVDGRLRAHVPREEVVGMEICRTTAAERPLAQIILGIALLGALYVPITSIIDWSEYGGALHETTVLICILPILLGTWLLFTALRRSVVMRVHTKSGTRKLLIGKRADLAEVHVLAHKLSTAYNIPIRNMVDAPASGGGQPAR